LKFLRKRTPASQPETRQEDVPEAFLNRVMTNDFVVEDMQKLPRQLATLPRPKLKSFSRRN
jgi:hypothetical protein